RLRKSGRWRRGTGLPGFCFILCTLSSPLLAARQRRAGTPDTQAAPIMTDTSAHAPKAWSGRFSEPVSDLVKRYTASVYFDRRMAAQDIRGSLAHARMLARQGIIGAQDLADIERGLETIAGEIERGEFAWNLDDEDVHLNIGKRLTALVGDAGKRLHTGRSRNDQVATDIRLWLRDAIDTILELI